VSNMTVTNTFSAGYPSWSTVYETDQMRVAAFSCAQMGWPVPDQCTSHAVSTFSY